MLTIADVRAQRRRRPPPSLKQLYQEYLLQRIEAYKNSLSREELLRLGDEAIAELQTTSEEQFILTEVLMLESVDRLISKRLRLRSFARWRKQHLALRAAQREPTHWGIAASHAVTRLLPRLEPGDHALVIGTRCESTTFLLAAHDAAVTYLSPDMTSVDRVETRMATESLGSDILAYVTQLEWLPQTERVDLLVLDTGAVRPLPRPHRHRVLAQLQARTNPGGVHLLVAGDHGPLPTSFGDLYSPDAWPNEPVVDPRAKPPTPDAAMAWSKKSSQNDTAETQVNVS